MNYYMLTRLVAIALGPLAHSDGAGLSGKRRLTVNVQRFVVVNNSA